MVSQFCSKCCIYKPIVHQLLASVRQWRRLRLLEIPMEWIKLLVALRFASLWADQNFWLFLVFPSFPIFPNQVFPTPPFSRSVGFCSKMTKAPSKEKHQPEKAKQEGSDDGVVREATVEVDFYVSLPSFRGSLAWFFMFFYGRMTTGKSSARWTIRSFTFWWRRKVATAVRASSSRTNPRRCLTTASPRWSPTPTKLPTLARLKRSHRMSLPKEARPTKTKNLTIWQIAKS